MLQGGQRPPILAELSHPTYGERATKERKNKSKSRNENRKKKRKESMNQVKDR